MADVEAIYPLSPQQEGMLLAAAAGPGEGVFLEQLAQELRGHVDLAIFERAWQVLVDRHAVLRTAFVWRDQAAPVQAVLRGVRATVAGHDWTGVPAAAVADRLAALLSAERYRGFDLGRPPLTRLALVRTGPGAHRLVWTQHHLVLDGWSLPILLEEFATAYAALRDGRAPALPPARPYRDYVAWLAGQDAAAAERFWRERLAGMSGPTPLGRPAPSARGNGAHGVEDLDLHQPLSDGLGTMARAHRVTPSTVVQGLWAALLGRYAGHDDVVVGTTVSGRPADLDGVDRMVGLFATTVPLRLAVRRDAPFWSWLADVQARHLAVRRFEHCSAGQVHAWSGLPASIRLFDSVLVFENYPAAAADGGGTAATFAGARTPYALTLLALTGASLRLQAVFDGRRLERDGVRARLEHLRRLAELAVRTPSATVGELQAAVADDEVPAGVAAEPAAPELRRPFEEPATDLERELAELWSRLLGLPRVGRDDDFFALGGHSLVATQLASRIRRAYEVDLPLRVLFEARTVRRLAAAVEDAVLREIEATA